MKKLVVSLSLLLVCVAYSAPKAPPKRTPSADCPVSSISDDYRQFFGISDSEIEFTIFKVQLNKTPSLEIFVAEKDSCGSRGCDYIIYEELANKCFQSLGQITGHIEVLEQTQNDYKIIQVKNKDTYLSKQSTSNFVFDPKTKNYIAVPVTEPKKK